MSLVLGLHFDGSDGSTTFTDASPSSHAFTANGNAQIDTAQSKFGGASALFDGADDYISTPNSADFNFGTGDFTIAGWIRAGDVTSTAIISTYASTTSGFYFYISSGSKLAFNCSGDGADITGTTSLSTNTWYHVAVTRSGTTLRLFLDGTQEASVTDSQSITSTAQLTIGGLVFGASLLDDFSGHIDDLIVDKGTALYTSSFTPPTGPFANPVFLTGIPSGEVFGTAAITGHFSVSLTGIASSEAFGSPTFRRHPDAISLTGIPSGESFGSVVVSNRKFEILTESADATDPSTVIAGLYEAIRETLLCAADCDESALYNLSMAEAQAAIDSLIGGKLFQDALTEVADGDVSTVVEIALRMVEQVAASDAVLTSWQTAMTVAEVATALDLLAAGWSFSMVETAEANDTITPFVAMLATLLEEAVATDTIAITLTVTVVSTETAAGADTVTTLAEFFETMDESAVATVTLRLGDDVYTGWVLNTEEGAVSEFQRYEFNSFCQLQGEYYAAGTDGIYRIGGSSDAGEAIVGYLKTGLLDFGSSLQKRMDSAWLAIATDGTVRMKVVTTDRGEAEETWYQVTSRDEGAVAENMRLKIGKGLKSRHWQFELVVEDASEFELEELQFIPMILTRRT